MRSRTRRLNLPLALAAALLPWGATAGIPDDVRPGTRVEVEGNRLDDRSMTAADLELKAQPGGVDEVNGMIASVDAADGRLKVHGVDVVVDADTEIKEDGVGPTTLDAFTMGRHAQAEGVFRDGVLYARELELKTAAPGEEMLVELVGIITRVDRAGSSIEVMGVDVILTPKTEIQVQ